MITLYNGEPIDPHRYQYLLASNGVFLVKENALFSAVVKVQPEELGLKPLSERLDLRKQVRVPFVWLHRAVEFFREVSRKHNSEAFLWIRMDAATGEVSLHCPEQVNSTCHVHAEPPDGGDDRLTIGTIHAHPADAFHSDGDVADEVHSDGLHVVVGNLHASVPDFAVSLAVKGRRKAVEPAEVLDIGFGFDSAWMKRITVR